MFSPRQEKATDLPRNLTSEGLPLEVRMDKIMAPTLRTVGLAIVVVVERQIAQVRCQRWIDAD